MTASRISCKATSFERAPRASRPPPDEWVSQEGPAPLHRWGNWGTRRRDEWPEASLKDLRRSGEPEAPILSGGCSNHGLPPPPWWRRRPPPPQLTHPPRERHVSSGSKDRVKKGGARSDSAEICRRKALGACVPSVQHGGGHGRPPPTPSLPQGRRLSLGALRWAGRRPNPARPLLAAAAARWRSHLPDMTNGRSAEPPEPAENKEYESQAARRPELYWGRRGGLCPTAGPRQPIRGQWAVPPRQGARGGSVRVRASEPWGLRKPSLFSPPRTVPILRGNREEKVPMPPLAWGRKPALLSPSQLQSCSWLLSSVTEFEVRKGKRGGLRNTDYLVRKSFLPLKFRVVCPSSLSFGCRQLEPPGGVGCRRAPGRKVVIASRSNYLVK